MKLSHWTVIAIVMLVIGAAAVMSPHPAAFIGSHANAAKAGVQGATPSAPRDTSAEQPFDYFPDHFVNQAKEPAEPIATF